VGNDPLGAVDWQGLWWGYIPSTWDEWWDWGKSWGQFIAEPLEYLNMGNDTLKCGREMYNIYPYEPPKYDWVNDPTKPIPIHAG
jgi:hypothetical protein